MALSPLFDLLTYFSEIRGQIKNPILGDVWETMPNMPMKFEKDRSKNEGLVGRDARTEVATHTLIHTRTHGHTTDNMRPHKLR